MKNRATLIAVSLLTALSPILSLSSPLYGAAIPTDFAQENKPATIKVLLEKHAEEVLIEAKGPYLVYNPLTNILIGPGGMKKKEWMTPSASGISWGEVFPGNFELRIVPKDSKTSLLVNGIEYKGCIEIYDMKGTLCIVNEVDVERYLKSILTFQFPQELDEEVMDAVAIVARTNAYYTAATNPVTYWHVDGKEVGYQGHALTLQNLHVDRAVNNTKHMVLSYKGMPFPATWTRDSAGKTAEFATFFRKNVTSPSGVETPFAKHDREKHSWKFSLSKGDLARALGAVGVSQFDLYRDPNTNKVYATRLNDGSKNVQFDFTSLQAALGSSRLKSSDFIVEMKGNEVLFSGFGEGHGVGLCLLSASAMADKGEKTAKILHTFFPGSSLERQRVNQ